MFQWQIIRIQDIITFLLEGEVTSTSNSGIKLWDWASFFRSINHAVILGLGTAAHPGFPPCGGTSPSFRCGTPDHIYAHNRNETKVTRNGTKITWFH